MLKVITPAGEAMLTRLETVRRDLGLPDGDASQDERLANLIATASDLVCQHLNRDNLGIETVEQTEHPRTTGPIILARDLAPVIESVHENGVLLAPDAYHLDGSLLHRAYPSGAGYGYNVSWTRNGAAVVSPFAGGGWCGRHVVIRYTAGFELLDGLPRAIERACLDVVFSLLNGGTRDQTQVIRSETVEGVGTTTYATSSATATALPIAPDRLMALERWRYRAGFG